MPLRTNNKRSRSYSTDTESTLSDMPESVGEQRRVPDFLVKTFAMLSSREHRDAVTWTSRGDSFIILNKAKFEREVLPQHFKHSKVTSFVRQLNMYSFRKLGGPDHWEYKHEHFCLHRRADLALIRRKTATGGGNGSNGSNGSNDVSVSANSSSSSSSSSSLANGSNHSSNSLNSLNSSSAEALRKCARLAAELGAANGEAEELRRNVEDIRAELEEARAEHEAYRNAAEIAQAEMKNALFELTKKVEDTLASAAANAASAAAAAAATAAAAASAKPSQLMASPLIRDAGDMPGPFSLGVNGSHIAKRFRRERSLLLAGEDMINVDTLENSPVVVEAPPHPTRVSKLGLDSPMDSTVPGGDAAMIADDAPMSAIIGPDCIADIDVDLDLSLSAYFDDGERGVVAECGSSGGNGSAHRVPALVDGAAEMLRPLRPQKGPGLA